MPTIPTGACPFSSLISFSFCASHKGLGQATGWTADVSSRLPEASQLLLAYSFPCPPGPRWGRPAFIKHPLFVTPPHTPLPCPGSSGLGKPEPLALGLLTFNQLQKPFLP